MDDLYLDHGFWAMHVAFSGGQLQYGDAQVGIATVLAHRPKPPYGIRRLLAPLHRANPACAMDYYRYQLAHRYGELMIGFITAMESGEIDDPNYVAGFVAWNWAQLTPTDRILLQLYTEHHFPALRDCYDFQFAHPN